jgi:F-type H+-transporting ATPase subunit epsilon
MAQTFRLKITTPFGLVSNGPARLLYLKTSAGEMTISPEQLPFVCSVEISKFYFIRENGQKEICASGGGMIYVDKKEVKLLLRTCEFKKDIDIERAKKKLSEAQAILNENKDDVNVTKLSIAKALNRIDVYNH